VVAGKNPYIVEIIINGTPIPFNVGVMELMVIRKQFIITRENPWYL